jgi:hypothetical protein
MLAGLTSLLVGFGKIGDMMQGRGFDETALWMGIGAMGISYAVLWIIWTPLLYLILSVFYLDVRVRQEALDLEWTAHTTAPQINAVVAPAGAPPPFVGAMPAETPTPSPTDYTPPQNPFATRPLDDENNTGSTPGAPQ